MSIYQIRRPYDNTEFNSWYIKSKIFTKSYGLSVSKENNDFCNVHFINENGKDLYFEKISYFDSPNALIVFKYDTNTNKYVEMLNTSSKQNPLSLSDLQNMILIVNASEGMYVTYKDDTKFYENSKFFKLSNDGKRIAVKLFNPSESRKIICFDDYPVDSKGLYFTKNSKDYRCLKDSYTINYSVAKSLPSQISAKYFEKYNPKLIENIFDDDDTLNYEVSFKYTDKYNLGEISFFRGKTAGYSVYGISMASLLDAVLNTCDFQDSSFENDDARKNYRQSCLTIFNKIKDKLKLADGELIQYLYDNYVKFDLENLDSIHFNVDEKENLFSEYGDKWKNKYKEIHMDLIDKGILNIKWKSETQMFTTVKSLYSDAIYQYRDKWLGYQSLDVYIPSLKIAIEYQGKQHYEPVDIFGGEEHFKQQQVLDNKKRDLCYINNVKLIEWKYDKPITKPDLKKVIEEEIMKQ